MQRTPIGPTGAAIENPRPKPLRRNVINYSDSPSESASLVMISCPVAASQIRTVPSTTAQESLPSVWSSEASEGPAPSSTTAREDDSSLATGSLYGAAAPD